MTNKEIKEASEKRIAGLNLKPNRNMPLNFECTDLKFRTAEDVAKRIMVLAILIGISHNQRRSNLKKIIEQNGLSESLSNNEKQLLNKWFLTRQDRINVGWFSECIEVLGWAIGLWDEIEYLDVCNEDKQVAKLPSLHTSFQDFIKGSHLIDRKLICEEFDFIYRMHGIAKVRNIGKLKEQTESAYREKHRAIMWVVGLENNWDDITTDT